MIRYSNKMLYVYLLLVQNKKDYESKTVSAANRR